MRRIWKFAYVNYPNWQRIPDNLPKQMFVSMPKLQTPRTILITSIQRGESGMVRTLDEQFMCRFHWELSSGGRCPNPTVSGGRQGKMDIVDLVGRMGLKPSKRLMIRWVFQVLSENFLYHFSIIEKRIPFHKQEAKNGGNLLLVGDIAFWLERGKPCDFVRV